MALKYKVGDKVRIKSLDWYNKNKNEYDEVDCNKTVFIPDMKRYCGSIVTIVKVIQIMGIYRIKEDKDDFNYNWTDEMIEGLVEEEAPKAKVNDLKYPKSYEECIGKLPINWDGKVEGYKCDLLAAFQKLLICRDIYWKIAGEEMGLVKSWKPDYTNPNEKRFAIHSYVVRGEDGVYRLIPVYSKIGEMRDALGERHILEFPTEETRDTFYENFKDLIEQCKELL